MKITTRINIPIAIGHVLYTVLNNGDLGCECIVTKIESNECGIYVFAKGKEDNLQRRFILCTYHFGGKHFGTCVFLTKEQSEKYSNWLKGNIEYNRNKKLIGLDRMKKLLSKLRKNVR